MKTIIIDGVEYNLTPKVLFKKGDFVVIQETTYQITEVENLNVTLSLNGRECLFDIDVLKNARLWDITKDAKDGDVLYARGNYFKEYIFMFSSFTEDNVISTHFGYDVFHETFDTKLSRFGRKEDFISVIPATKEQRDLLFKKMEEGGYEWDAENKELNKKSQRMISRSERSYI